MKIVTLACVSLLPIFAQVAPNSCSDSSDDKQSQQQEVLLKEATAQTGMPNIQNFQERKTLKDILELRDQANLSTYTYLQSLDGHLIFLGNTIGYGIPYSTQYTNPQKLVGESSFGGVVAQADPNGLFSPADAEGTWILMQNPQNPKDVEPVYMPFRFHSNYPNPKSF